jgi:hypothetical protein
MFVQRARTFIQVNCTQCWSHLVLSTNCIISVICGGQFYWWRKLEYPEKTTDLSQVTDKLNVVSHNVVSTTPRQERGSNAQL